MFSYRYVLVFSILAPGGRVSHPRMKKGSMQKSGCLAFQWALWAAKCCHGSNKWDDNSKNRPKCCHGSNEWDDNSGAPITTCFTTYGSHCLQKLFCYAADVYAIRLALACTTTAAFTSDGYGTSILFIVRFICRRPYPRFTITQIVATISCNVPKREYRNRIGCFANGEVIIRVIERPARIICDGKVVKETRKSIFRYFIPNRTRIMYLLRFIP